MLDVLRTLRYLLAISLLLFGYGCKKPNNTPSSSSKAPSAQTEQILPSSDSTDVPDYSLAPKNSESFFRSQVAYESRLVGLPDQDSPTSQEFIQQVVGRVPDEQRNPDLEWENQLKRGIDLGRKDPSLFESPEYLLALGDCFLNSGYSRSANTVYLNAIRNLSGKNRKPGLLTLLHNRAFGSAMEVPNPRHDFVLFESYLSATIAWLKNDFNIAPTHQRHAYQDITECLEDLSRVKQVDLLEKFTDEFIHIEGIPEWLTCAVRGYKFYIEGSRLCYYEKQKPTSVNPPLAHKLLKRSAGYFKKALELNSHFPEPAVELMSIAHLGHSESTVDHWFEKAISIQSDCSDAFFNRQRMLRPKYGGSIKLMSDFTKTCESTFEKNGITSVPVMLNLFLLVRDIIPEETKGKSEILKRPQFKEELRNSIRRIVADDSPVFINGRSVPASYFLTIMAMLDLESGNIELANESFRKLKDRQNGNALLTLKMTDQSFDVLRSRPYVLSSEYRAEAERMAELLGDSISKRIENESEIINLISQVLNETDNPVGQLYFGSVEQSMSLERSYRAGKTIKIPFDQQLSLWESNDIRQITYESNNSVIVNNRTGIPTILTSILDLPGPKTILASFENLENAIPLPDEIETLPSNHHSLSFVSNACGGAGILVRSDKSQANFSLTIGANANSTGKLAFGFADSPLGNQLSFRFNNESQTQNLRMNMCNGFVEVFVNDEFVFRTSHPRIEGANRKLEFVQSRLGLGNGRVRISNIQVQPWGINFSPFEFNNDNHIDIYSRYCRANPDNPRLRFWLAQALHKAGKLSEAKRNYLESIKLGLDQHRAAFYLGDIFEAQGDIQSAIDWYRIGALADGQGTFRLEQAQADSSTPHNWAAFRYRWLMATSPNKKMAKSESAVPPIAMRGHEWLTNLLLAQELALKSEFANAELTAKKCLKHCSPELESLIISIVKTYSQKKIFTREPNADTIYRTGIPVAFFADVTSDLSYRESKPYREGQGIERN